MNELKPEDMIRDFETAMRNGKYFGYIYPKVTYGQLEAAITILREKDAEIERLKQENKDLHDNTDVIIEMVTIARSEAITEFAEKLKTFYNRLPGKTVGGSVEYHIDQIAKEMKGENSNDH